MGMKKLDSMIVEKITKVINLQYSSSLSQSKRQDEMENSFCAETKRMGEKANSKKKKKDGRTDA